MKERKQKRALALFDKHSDYLEAYSSLVNFQGTLEIIAVANKRNDADSMDVFLSILHSKADAKVEVYSNKQEAFCMFSKKVGRLQQGDLLIAPFIRYREIWKSVAARRRGIITIHLSETIPDSFGLLGYRLAFCNRKNSRFYFLGLLLMPLYGLLNKPDLCYFPLMPHLKNPFTKKSLEPLKPPLAEVKYELIHSLVGTTPRPLVVAGFGYDAYKMARSQKWDQFIATSKNKEIIIDGVVYEIPIFITAEDILLFGEPSSMISYTSTAVVWARRWYPNLRIVCYEASALSQQYGFLFGRLAKTTLRQAGIEVYDEDCSMLAYP